MNKQEALWEGEFGDAYTDRNVIDEEATKLFFNKILPTEYERAMAKHELKTAIEFGCGSGANLAALKCIGLECSGVEVNQYAALKATNNTGAVIYNTAVNDELEVPVHDLVLTKGFLIHVAPENLESVYRKIYETAKYYILICEYYSKQPQEIVYRGNAGSLWKRDFCGEIMDQYPDLELLDYGFVYDRDPVYMQDSITWWLLEKK